MDTNFILKSNFFPIVYYVHSATDSIHEINEKFK